MAENVDSTSDERIGNNLMRHQYRVLNDEEKVQMMEVKDQGLAFVNLLHVIGGTGPFGEVADASNRQASRELALAQTKIEEAVMWAVKHVTG